MSRRPRPLRRFGAYLLGVVAFAIALAIRFAVNSLLPPAGFPFLTFFPAVVLATLFAGLGPGLMVSALSAAAAKYWFIPRLGSFALASPADAIALGFFVGIVLVDIAVIHVMTISLRRVRQERARNAELAEARRTLAEELHHLNATLEARVRDEVAAREAAQARAAHAERMQALGQLAGGIAHDFNNVLQAVQGGGALIARRPEDPEGVRRLARMIIEAAARGAAITRRLLAFSRRGDLRAEPVDAAVLLTGLREILAHTLGTGVEVRVETAADPPLLLADKGQLETVLVNLSTNARDAMQGTGTLTLAASAESLRHDDGPGHPIALKAGFYVRLSVSDTGSGMDAATLARASEPFFTTKPRGQGTGLGLAMARGFAEQSGGGLHIESAPGRGTVVKLWFPLAERTGPADPPRAKTSLPALAETRARLLVVDDDEIVLETLVEQMQAAGYAVLSASSAASALALLDAGEDADLMMSDLSMPGMDGLTLVREAQRRRPGLPAILLTGFATDSAEIAVGEAVGGTFSLLCKPIGGQHLAERVAVLLEGAAAGG